MYISQREILLITITIFLTIIGWIVADLAHISQTQQVDEANPKFSKPLNIRIEKGVFTVLEQRK